MKLFAVENGQCTSSFDLQNDYAPHRSSNAHSGGIVILAETAEDAIRLMKGTTGTLTEIPLDKAGIVLQADGDC